MAILNLQNWSKAPLISLAVLGATSFAAPTLAANIATPFGDPNIDKFEASSIEGVDIFIKVNPVGPGGLCAGGALIATAECITFEFLPDGGGNLPEARINTASTPATGAFQEFRGTPPGELSIKDVVDVQFPLGGMAPPPPDVPVPIDNFVTFAGAGDAGFPGSTAGGDDYYDLQFVTSVLFTNLPGGNGSIFALNTSGIYESGTGETYRGTLAFSNVSTNNTVDEILAFARSADGYRTSFDMDGVLFKDVPEPTAVGGLLMVGLGILSSRKGNKKES